MTKVNPKFLFDSFQGGCSSCTKSRGLLQITVAPHEGNKVLGHVLSRIDDVYTPLVNGIWCGNSERAQEMYLFLMFEFHLTKLPLWVQNGSTANSQFSMLHYFNDV